jgi:hypothetical protein
MTESELWMERRHVGKRGETLKHGAVPKLEMVDDPRRVERSRSHCHESIQIGGVGGALRPSRHSAGMKRPNWTVAMSVSCGAMRGQVDAKGASFTL